MLSGNPRYGWIKNYQPIYIFFKATKTFVLAGPLMRVYTPREVLFASSYSVAKDLCDEQRFEKNIVGPLEELRILGGDGLFTAHNHEHNWERTLVCYVTSKKSESAALARVGCF